MPGNMQRLPAGFFHPLQNGPPRMGQAEPKKLNGKGTGGLSKLE